METKTKTFDAVAESRKWREATSRKLDAMSLEERIAHLRERARAIRRRTENPPARRGALRFLPSSSGEFENE